MGHLKVLQHLQKSSPNSETSRVHSRSREADKAMSSLRIFLHIMGNIERLLTDEEGLVLGEGCLPSVPRATYGIPRSCLSKNKACIGESIVTATTRGNRDFSSGIAYG
jgi:hypothetical protein